MDPARILLPVTALAGLTFVVLLLTAYVRFKAAFAGRVRARDFRYGESADVPGDGAEFPVEAYLSGLGGKPQ